jgi:hypothetical protein
MSETVERSEIEREAGSLFSWRVTPWRKRRVRLELRLEAGAIAERFVIEFDASTAERFAADLQGAAQGERVKGSDSAGEGDEQRRAVEGASGGGVAD